MKRKPLAGFSGDMVIFGCGTMASAMLHRWLECGLDPARVTAIRPSGTPVAPDVAVHGTADGMVEPGLLLLGIKPQMLGTLAEQIEPLAGPNTLVISILAGVDIEELQRLLPRAGCVVRAMPNLPVATGNGVVATVGDAHDPAVAKLVGALMAPLGLVYPMVDESGFNLITALTGCGPAFLYRFVSALAGAAARLGIDSADAERLARATVAGAAGAVADAPESMSALAAAVASPGGMTQAGLDVLDSDGRLVALMAETLRAARDRGRELAAAARSS